MLDERNCARAHTFSQTACFVRAVHVFVCQCDLSRLNLFIAAIILLLFHFGYCSWCICYGMFSILCLAVSAMVCDIYLILHHSINIGWKKRERCSCICRFIFFSFISIQLYIKFSCPAAHSKRFAVVADAATFIQCETLVKNLFNIILLYFCYFFLLLLLLFSFVSNVIGCDSLGQMLHWICTWESHARLYYNTLYREHPHFNINYIITSTIPTINTTTKNERIIMYGREKKVHWVQK